METNLNTPRWNLDSIFSSLDSVEHKQSILTLKSYLEEAETLLDTADKFTRSANNNFDFETWLATYLKTKEKIEFTARTLDSYAYINYSVDTTSTRCLNNLAEISKLTSSIVQLDIKFSTMLISHQKYLESFYQRFPEFSEYKFLLEEVLEDKKHQMLPAEEKLALDLSLTSGGESWGRLQEQLISNLKDSNGITFNELRNNANDSDPELRYKSWQTELSLLEQNRISFAASLSNLKGETLLLNKKRNWDEAIDRSLSSARMKKETLDALISSLEDALPMWRDYFQAKALLLRKAGATVSKTAGTKDEKGIAFYDLFAPLENPNKNDAQKTESLFSKKWTFDEAKEYVIKEYYSFSKEMGDFAKNAFDSGWIDAEVRQGKVGGAYDEDFPLGHQSRILCNFTGDFGGIVTLAHELGHAYHFSCLKRKPATFFNYPMTLAETASTFAETIVKQDMLLQSSGFDKIRIMDLDLTDASQVLVDILCRFYFEKSVFEERKNGELNADDFCRLMREAQEKSYGCGLNSERHEYMWAVKGHYYSTNLDFYNYPYAFGQLFAAGLYQRSLKEGSAFAKTYAELLSHTGNMSCESLCEKAGFDITKKDFWKSGIEMYAKEVSEFIEFAKQFDD